MDTGILSAYLKQRPSYANRVALADFVVKVRVFPAITAGQIGYSIKYTWVSGVIPNGSSFTFGSFTNTPVGIYLLTVGTFTAFAFDPLDRLDMGYTATTNITFLSSSTTMEFGGNALTKMGIGYSVPISITNSTNQLTISGSVSGSDVNYIGGASSLLRLA